MRTKDAKRLTWRLSNRKVPTATDIAILEYLEITRGFTHSRCIDENAKTGGGYASRGDSLKVLTERGFISQPTHGKDAERYYKITEKGKEILGMCRRIGPLIDEVEKKFKRPK